MTLRSTFVLQAKILRIILGKIQSPCFRRYSLAGIVLEFPALAVQGVKAFFDAEDLVISDFCSVNAVSTGALYLFSKQHGGTLR